MDFELARFNMIEQQIRPWNVLDQTVLDLLSVIKREQFVAPGLENMAFSDLELPIRVAGKDTGEVMLAPKVEARILQELAVKGHETVLEVGTGTGYMAALLASRAAHVTTVEIQPAIAELARNNLAAANLANVTVVQGDAANGLKNNDRFDVIVVSGSTPVVPEGLKQQLKTGGRLAVIVGESPVMSAVIITRVAENQYTQRALFETLARPLANAPQAVQFVF